ncbi:MAG: IPTL-CTERM sorting domain-containing protein [Planctomycetes bacterium]|nr:IPTL-CTERM sorting domain-containing protein [Planctomycetota bacterium]
MPTSVAIGDLNGDLVPDMTVANSRSNNVSVLLGVGDGTFAAAVHYPAGVGPRSVAVGDLDGDQVPDLAVAIFLRNNVAVLLGLGDGTFAAPEKYTAVGRRPRSVAIGDLDGDLVPDLALANPATNRVSVLLNQSECNGNLIHDDCDIDCGPPGGPCDVPGCGQSEDCNGNGVPDECGNPVCGDGCVMGTEDCDDGNTEPGDGCDGNCLFEGACCLGTVCIIRNEPFCLDSGGTFLGFFTSCDAPDGDGDGLVDECDGCPTDSHKFEPGICGCGVDDGADSDDDGVPDNCDVCPDSDDGAAGALGDADGDGVLNCNDLCPDADDAVFAPECESAIPTTSQWGLIVLTLLLLAGGKILFGSSKAFVSVSAVR